MTYVLLIHQGDARAAYERALKLVHSEAERRFLEQRLAELGG
jgi:predicted RNA polymerase sigma factor